MRFTRTTLLIIIVAVATIVAVLLFNASPASAPSAPTEIPAPSTEGPLFTGMTTGAIQSLTIEELATGEVARYTRDSDGVWALADDTSGFVIDSAALERSADAFANLVAYDSFATEALADYALETPAYLAVVQLADGSSAELYIGGLNPTGNRRYVVAVTRAAAENAADAEATLSPDSPILADEQRVSTVIASAVDGWISLFNAPIYVPTPLPTPLVEATAEAAAEATAEATAAP